MDRTLRKRVLKKIPYGLFVIASATRQRSAAIIANWVMQVSFDPPLLAIALEFDSGMRHLIDEAKAFSVNMLPTGSTKLAKTFLKTFPDQRMTVADKEFVMSARGLPWLKEASDTLECKVLDSVRTGDHVLYIGEVLDGISHSDHPILTLKETGLQYSR
jgi:flavin reductase (DIM6/NTAB) family NADH-FMN oxidoreductase RutF